MLLLEGLESLALLYPLFNRQLQFDLGGLGDVLSVLFQLLLTCNHIMKILAPRHEVGSATDIILLPVFYKASWRGR